MVAMMFMQFRIGYDMGIILAKSIIFSMVAVFFLMPGLLLTFSKAIDNTHHKSFVPKITVVGKFCVATRYIIPPILIVGVIIAFFLSNKANYVYDTNTLESSTMSDNKFSVSMVNKEFGMVNQLAVIVPNGDYEKEAQTLKALEKLDVVKSCQGLGNIEAMDGYMLTDKLTPRQFAELIDLDIEVADMLYSAYALDQSDYGALVSGVSEYEVPFIDMFLFIYDQKESGNITLDDDLEETLTDAYSQICIAKDQLLGEDNSRFVLELNVPYEGEETTAALHQIRNTVAKFYNIDDILLVGNATSDKDLGNSFATDNTIITVLTALFVMIILLFTFQSAGLPVLLVVTIQGSIWMNFSLPYLLNENVYFLGYLVVSAIQMGATIDYAIVITSRYMDLKTYMPIKGSRHRGTEPGVPYHCYQRIHAGICGIYYQLCIFQCSGSGHRTGSWSWYSDIYFVGTAGIAADTADRRYHYSEDSIYTETGSGKALALRRKNPYERSHQGLCQWCVGG